MHFRIICILGFLCSVVFQYSEAIAEYSIALSEKNKNALLKVERYLNNITTISAKFVQVSSSGDQYEGSLKLSRPGNLRIDYKPPYPVIITANSSYLSFYDTELGQESNISIDDTTVGILLAKDFSFSNNSVMIKEFQAIKGVIRLSVRHNKNPASGLLTLIFSETPMELRKWTILDAQNIVTHVAFTESQHGEPIPLDIFEYTLPDRTEMLK